MAHKHTLSCLVVSGGKLVCRQENPSAERPRHRRTPPVESRSIEKVLDDAYEKAVAAAGPNPNALGFLRRVKGSRYYRPPPAGTIDPGPKEHEMKLGVAVAELAAKTGRW